MKSRKVILEQEDESGLCGYGVEVSNEIYFAGNAIAVSDSDIS